MSTPTTQRRKLIGTVVSTKMTKTVVVRVDRVLTHPKYGKQYTVSKRYAAHTEKPDYIVGDRVVMEETRPLSATKHWRVLRKA